MSVPFTWNFVVLCVVQAVAVLGPRRPPAWRRLRARPLLGLIPLATIGGGAVFLGNVEGSVERAVDLASIATPLLALAAVVTLWPRLRWLGLLAPVLFAVAWRAQGERAGDLAALALIILACATLAWLTGIAAPRWALAVGIVVATVVDVIQVLNHDVQPVAQALSRAEPPQGLPRLQEARYAGATMGWGDVYLAAVLGAVVAGRAARTAAAFLAVLVAAVLYGFLFLVLDVIPATVPVAVGLLVVAAIDRRWASEELRPARAPRSPGPGRRRLRGTLRREAEAKE
jgi:hypothetical protein